MATENQQQPEDKSQIEEHEDGTAVYIDPELETGHAEEDEDDEGEERSAAVVRENEDPDAGPTEAEELRLAANEAAREAIRARRRKERKERKAAQVEREESLRRELALERGARQQLEERFNVMDRKASGVELANIDQAIRNGEAAAEELTDAMAQAVNTANGKAQTEAMNKLLETRERVKELKSIRQRIATPQRQAPTIDPVVRDKVVAWTAKNTWYNVRGGDDDSMVILGLDAGLVRDGYQANTDAYWAELDRRGAKYLPHRFKPAGAQNEGGGNGDRLTPDDKRPARSTVGGSGREATSGSRPTGFLISAERVKALKDANMWDDPVERKKMIKSFRDYDKAHAPKT